MRVLDDRAEKDEVVQDHAGRHLRGDLTGLDLKQVARLVYRGDAWLSATSRASSSSW